MQRVTIEKLTIKDPVESIFLVKYINLAHAKDGKPYVNIILTDATGDLEGRAWNNAVELTEQISVSDFIKVQGKANLYMGKKQFIIQGFEKVDSALMDMDDFTKKSKFDSEQMYQELMSLVSKLSDVYVRDLLTNVLSDNEIQRRLKTWQAGKTIHHAYKGGLLEHVLSCANLSVTLSKVYGVNENYVVAGAVLHDLCKIYELTDGANVEYTEEGKLIGHLVKGLEIVDKYSYRITNFPYQVKMHIKHILLSHHGEYEYGSPKIPQTKEAMLVHLIDLMDSKMHSFETVIKNDQAPGNWTGFVRHLDRIIYKEELPFYPEYIEGKAAADTKRNSKPKTKHYDREVKQNLGSLFKDIKID
jgi:3'-5' exoribonuclease